MSAEPDALDIRLDVADPASVDRAKEVVASHLDRFAFREAPLSFRWEIAKE